MAGILHDGPLMVFDMRRPDAHQRRRSKQVRIRGDQENRRGNRLDLRKSVWRMHRLRYGVRLAGMRVDLDPALGAVHIGASIGRRDFQIERRAAF